MGAYLRSSIVLTIPSGSDGSTFAECDAGDIATSGGFSSSNGEGSLDIYESRPAGGEEDAETPSSYYVRAFNDTPATHELEVWVVCLDLG